MCKLRRQQARAWQSNAEETLSNRPSDEGEDSNYSHEDDDDDDDEENDEQCWQLGGRELGTACHCRSPPLSYPTLSDHLSSLAQILQAHSNTKASLSTHTPTAMPITDTFFHSWPATKDKTHAQRTSVCHVCP